MNSKNRMLIFLTIFLLTFSMIIGNSTSYFSTVSTEREHQFLPSAVTIDGNLSAGEWSEAAHKEQWYMDADPENQDGYNYMYLDEDEDNLYVALDLCSDQTNNESGEWVGLWLNTNETVTDATLPDWESSINAGMESLIHDVENDVQMPFFNPDGTTSGWYYSSQSLDGFTAQNGSFEGTHSDIQAWGDSQYVNVTSEFNGTHHVYILDIELTFADIFYVFDDLFIDAIKSVQMEIYTRNNDTLDAAYLSIRDSNGVLDYYNSTRTTTINTGPVVSSDQLTANPSYFTIDDKVVFSLVGINNAPFTMSLDMVRFMASTNRTMYLADGYLNPPYSTIIDYEIAWSFGPSENNASDHRSFEIKIPKMELEGYDTDTDLGIFVAGYGTLISFPNTHNWVYANGITTGIPEEDTSKYFYFDMPLKGTTITETTTPTTIDTGTTSPTSPPGNGDFPTLILVGGVGAAGLVIVLLVVFMKKK